MTEREKGTEMAQVAVFGASGTAGSRIVREAARRGHKVVAVVRDPASAPAFGDGVRVVQGDVLNPASVAESTRHTHTVVIAVGGTAPDLWVKAAKTVVDSITLLSDPRPRIIHMGGGASLLAPDGARFLDSPHFPEEFLPPAKGQAEALDWYRQHAAEAGVDWTYVSPPPVDFAPGERTGSYRTSLETPVVDDDGRSVLSYEDFAVAIVDEIETSRHRNTRYTVGY